MESVVKSRGLTLKYSEENESVLLKSPYTLGLIRYSSTTQEPRTKRAFDPRVIELHMPNLASLNTNEVIEVDTPVSHGRTGEISWSRNEEFQLLSIQVKSTADRTLDEITYLAYKDLLDCVVSSPFPYLIRMWNFFGQINEGEGDEERYRRFCLGRLSAFESMNIPTSDFPSASALGNASDDLIIYLISSKTPGQNCENPDQERAYQYPKQYGPASPSFARATHCVSEHSSLFFISGTASILGHKSVYTNDIALQTHKTLDNIELLIKTNCPKNTRINVLKVYVRRPQDLAIIKDIVDNRFSYPIHALYLNADICRAELDVEIEGYCHLANSAN